MLNLLKSLILQTTIIILPTNWILPDNFGKCNDKYIWVYQIDKKTIYACKGDKFKMSLLHELWHSFYYLKLNEEEKAFYKNLYLQDKILKPDTIFLKDWNEFEEFARDFAFIYLDKSKDNKRIEYIKELIEKY